MLQLGKINRLQVIKETPFGLYLGTEQHQVLLPSSSYDSAPSIGDWLDVLVYTDGDGNFVASFEKPKVYAGECASLKVVDTANAGAFLDWGMDKDILVPHNQQDRPMEAGYSYVVYVYADRQTDRLVASSKLRHFLHETSHGLQEGQSVSLLIAGRSPMGFKVVINHTHLGLLHKNDVFGTIQVGDSLQGFIKTIRADGKIDTCLQFHNDTSRASLYQQILQALKDNEGVLWLTDKSEPDAIKAQFGVSKGAYKKALGALYKDKKIHLSKTEIRLVE